jgi:hypothetical protein
MAMPSFDRSNRKLWTYVHPNADMKWWAQAIFNTAYDRIGQPSSVIAERLNSRIGPGSVSARMLDSYRSGESLPPFDIALTTLLAAGADIGSLSESIVNGPHGSDPVLAQYRPSAAFAYRPCRPPVGSQEPWDRLLKTLTQPVVGNELSIRALELETVGLYDLETQVPARQAFQFLRHRLDILAEMLAATLQPSLRQRLIRTCGETAVLGAWMAWDQADHSAANRMYKLTFAAAQDSNEISLSACALGYMSYAASAQGRFNAAQRMLRSARERINAKALPATYAWLAAREAEELSRTDPQNALRLMDMGMSWYEKTQSANERPWAGFLDLNRMLSFALTVNLRCKRFDEARQIAMRTLKGTGSPKIRVLLLLELAAAQISVGDVEEGINLTTEALNGVLGAEMTWGLPKLAELGQLLTAYTSYPQATRLAQEIAAVAEG